METMEEYKTIRIINNEPEFSENAESRISADFFVLCEDDKTLFNQAIYSLESNGMSFLNWVVRACGSQPQVLKVQENSDVLETIRPYLKETSQYSVVLFADTPLVSRAHIMDLLNFVNAKRMSVCKLKRGFVFNNDYIRENSEFYSIDEYDFSSDDFFVPSNAKDFYFIKDALNKKVLDYHKRNGVYLDNEQTITIDANVEIGVQSKIASGTCILNGSKIGNRVFVGGNSIIDGSSIENDVSVASGAVIKKSIVKNSSKVEEQVVIKNSVIGENSEIMLGAKVVSSSMKEFSKIKQFAHVNNVKLCEYAIIGDYSKVLGETDKTIIGAGSEIGMNCEIIDSVIAKDSFIENNEKISNKVDR